MDYGMGPAKHFRDLLAWQSAYKLTLRIYAAANSFPQSEMYGLTSQIKRAIVSVTSNIAAQKRRINSMPWLMPR